MFSRPHGWFCPAREPCPRCIPEQGVHDWAAVYSRVLDVYVPAASDVLERHPNKPIEAHHGRLKAQRHRCLARSASISPMIASGMPSCPASPAAAD
jgi:hypothetical protein